MTCMAFPCGGCSWRDVAGSMIWRKTVHSTDNGTVAARKESESMMLEMHEFKIIQYSQSKYLVTSIHQIILI